MNDFLDYRVNTLPESLDVVTWPKQMDKCTFMCIAFITKVGSVREHFLEANWGALNSLKELNFCLWIETEVYPGNIPLQILSQSRGVNVTSTGYVPTTTSESQNKVVSYKSWKSVLCEIWWRWRHVLVGNVKICPNLLKWLHQIRDQQVCKIWQALTVLVYLDSRPGENGGRRRG